MNDKLVRLTSIDRINYKSNVLIGIIAVETCSEDQATVGEWKNQRSAHDCSVALACCRSGDYARAINRSYYHHGIGIHKRH